MLTFLLPFLLLLSAALCAEYRIDTVQNLIDFASSVNAGTSYSGTTVFLDADLDFSGQSSLPLPIGQYESQSFNGVFDGQGHIISKLSLNSSTSLNAVGFFGVSTGTTIQNFVVGDSCSFMDSYDSDQYNPFVGGVIGYCTTRYSSCKVENCVNMGSVSFKGDTTKNVFIGGIAGALYSSTYVISIKNCVNYGSLTHSEASGYWVEIGGIVGIAQGTSSSSTISVQNCLNYGAITSTGSSMYLAVGGIIGASYYTYIDNCVASALITTNKTSNYTGGIVGYISKYTDVTHSYWSKAMVCEIVGYVVAMAVLASGSPFNPISFDLDNPVTIGAYNGKSLINALNAAADHYSIREYSHWILNKAGNALSFTIDGRATAITMNSNIILLPSLAGTGSSVFDGWYTDTACTTHLTAYEATGDLGLYGLLKEGTSTHTITFDTRGGSPSVAPITRQFGSAAVALPTGIMKANHEFLWWEDVHGNAVPNEFPVPAQDTTLYASWLCLHITTPEDLISFSKAVNTGKDFSGTTVFLDADLDLSGEYSAQFVPIGYDSSNYFNGVFDGQGHIISNLDVESPYYAALFGHSEGTSIQNVVIDESCSFVDSFNTDFPHIGGIIGYCLSEYGSCLIENCVNMGSMSFKGNATGNVFIGGFAGAVTSTLYLSIFKNCVNYGSLTHSGAGDYWIEMGGIAGITQGSAASSNVSVQNCLNYGAITSTGTSVTLVMGGVVGNSFYSYFENCISSGKVSANKVSNFISNIVGYVTEYTEITHCYWTGNTGMDKAYGYNASGITVTESSLAPMDKTTLDSLNTYAAAKGTTWGTWLMLHMNGGRIGTLPYEELIAAQKAFPAPAMEGNTFLFWCKDAECSTQYDPEAEGEGGSVAALYAGWVTNTVAFDLGNGTVVKRPFNYNEPIEYPNNLVKEGHTFSWDPKLVFMPARNLTITALWTPNNYTVTFNPNGGSVSQSTKILLFDSIYGDLPTPTRMGYTFLGWFTERTGGNKIESGGKVTIHNNHTLYAHWLEVTQGQVEIVFSTKDMCKEEIEGVIKKYTDADFTITVIEDNADEVRVIVEFAGVEEAKAFMNFVRSSSETKDIIEDIKFVFDSTGSFSSAHLPMSLLCLI